MKVSLENVEAILLEKKIDSAKVSAIIKDLTQAAEEEKADNATEKGPKAKWEHLIVINDPENKLGNEWTGWVIVQQDGQDAGTAIQKLRDATKEQNEGAKRKKSLIQNFGEAFDGLKSKFLKDKGLKIKTKTAVRVLTINGKTL